MDQETSPQGKIYCICYCGDLYKFYVDHQANLVGIENHILGCINETITLDDVPKAVRRDLLEQIHDDFHGKA